MRYRLEIAEHLVQQLDGLPTPVRKSLFGGLYLAAQALGTSRGKRAWGERVQNFSPPMYILTSQGHRLLYEVDTRAHALLVRSLAQPQAEEPPPAPSRPAAPDAGGRSAALRGGAPGGARLDGPESPPTFVPWAAREGA